MDLPSIKDIDGIVDEAINRAHKKCLLESDFQDNSDRSINALKRLKALGNEPTELLLEHESYRSPNDYSLIHKACIECLSLGMNLQKLQDPS